ncbi:MAG: hypothetical protein N2Z20_02205 [Elusimicrobiales bacterium]|nr:hypothetical protein [Elusimicrobiales bacterium]
MRKIKGLRVPIHYYDIERKIKKKDSQIEISTKDEDFEYNLKTIVSQIVSKFKISVLYDTFEIDKIEFLNRYIPLKKVNYISCGFLTFGEEVQNFKKTLTDIEKKIFDIVVLVHSKTSFEIIKDMVFEEAKKERLSIEEIIFVYEPFSQNLNKDIIEKVFVLIDPTQSQIQYINNQLTPLYTWIFIIPWVSLRK